MVESAGRTGTAACRGFCVEDGFRNHLFGKACLRALQGLSAALLMPIEVLEHLRQGRAPERRVLVSWVLSAALSAGVLIICLQNGQAGGAGHGQSLLPVLVAVTFVAILNGRLQDGGYRVVPIVRPESCPYPFGGFHPRGHRPVHRHYDIPNRIGTTENAAPPSPTPAEHRSQPGVCCGDCRQCQNDICVRTGKQKKGRKSQ